jgi:peptide/nickel transport system permease protein
MKVGFWNRLFKSGRKFWREFRRDKRALVGLVAVSLINVVAIMTPFIAPYPARRTGVGSPFTAPGPNYLLGTDNLGRDILSDVLWSAGVELTVAYLSVLIATVLGILIGSTAGFFGGWIDALLSRVMEFFFVIPPLFLSIVLVAMFGANIWNIVFAIGITSWPSTARLARAEFMSLKEREFVESARAIGAGKGTIMFSEILPNAISPLIVNVTVQFATAILTEGLMGFFGLSDPRLVSWGDMLNRGVPYMERAWWIPFWPGLAITLSCLCFNLMGEGLHDAIAPKTRRTE